MKSIRDVIKRFEQPEGKRMSAEEMVEALKKHPYVKEFCDRHADVTDDMLVRSITDVYETAKEHDQCAQCPGLDRCPNLVKGHRSILYLHGLSIKSSYRSCEKWEAAQAQRRRENLIQSHHIPKEITAASFASFERDPERLDALEAVLEFCRSVEPGTSATRGVYLYGPLGVGKSYLLGAAARRLADRGISSLMIYSPDFFREIKDAIQDHSLKDKLQALKDVPVLIFDDIGAENLSAWARDEVLGAILQHRMTERLPTLYTSNYDFEQLEQHLAESSRGDIDRLKAKRIMERIRYYTDAYFVGGKNRRKKG